jgi:signal transduction histidine kinase
VVAVNRAAAFGVAARWVLHDLRSPAQSLTLMADLIADPTEDLEEILRDACGHLARSLDLLSRVLHPPAPTEIGPISVREPVAFVADLQRAGRTHVRFEVALDPALPAASGVARHLEHALLNLVLHATEELRSRDTGVIRVGGRREGEEVRLTVSWDAPPPSPERAPRLLELPTDLSPAEHPLAVCVPVAGEVLRQSGATLAYSAEGGTPSFVITLPLWRPAPGPERPAGSR